jgi:hypothetical protein
MQQKLKEKYRKPLKKSVSLQAVKILRKDVV